jgi:phosphocarrier protein
VRVNAKSILGVLVLAVEPNAEVTIEVDGPDEQEALAAIVELVANKFNTE